MEKTRIQPGLQLQLVLDTPLDANKASVGDPISAHTLQSVGGIRRGAHVYGRVSRILNYNDQVPTSKPERSSRPSKHAMYGQHAGEVLIGIEFSQIEFRRSRVPFMARLIDLESQPGARDIQIRGFGYFEDGAIVQYDPPRQRAFMSPRKTQSSGEVSSCNGLRCPSVGRYELRCSAENNRVELG